MKTRQRVVSMVTAGALLLLTAPAARADGRSVTAERAESRPWRAVLLSGVGLAVLGIAAEGVGVAYKLRDGSCAERGPDGCERRYAFSGQGRALLGGGLSLVLVGLGIGSYAAWQMGRVRVAPQVSVVPTGVLFGLGGHL